MRWLWLVAVASLGGCAGAGGEDAGPDATLSLVVEDIFSPSCSAAVCHGGDGPARGLKLDAEDVHAQLVDVESSLAGERYVVPGDPEASLLFRVLTGDVEDIRQMPPNSPLSEEKIELVRTWIEDGAADD